MVFQRKGEEWGRHQQSFYESHWSVNADDGYHSKQQLDSFLFESTIGIATILDHSIGIPFLYLAIPLKNPSTRSVTDLVALTIVRSNSRYRSGFPAAISESLAPTTVIPPSTPPVK